MSKVISLYREEINSRLKSYMTPKETLEGAEVLNDAMSYSLLDGGKRIRPIMSLGFCTLCGGDYKLALPFACAVEMVHCYSLIHDDLPCMDNDTLRRGKPTNHVIYGEALALLAGDGLFTKAFETAAEAKGIDAEERIEAVLILSKFAGAQGMIGGQCIDLTLNEGVVSADILRQMDMGKTVALIAAACQLGCIAAKADRELVRAAKEYAEYVGMAFQIRDDVLGMIGDKASLGKTVGLDAENGKVNYVSFLGVDAAQALVEDYTQKAVEVLDRFPGDTMPLKELTRDLVERMI